MAGDTQSHSGEAGSCHGAQMCFYILTTGLATLVPLNVSPGSTPTLSSLCPPTGNGDWAIVPSERTRGLGWSWARKQPVSRASCVESWVNRISGPRPLCDLAGPGRLCLPFLWASSPLFLSSRQPWLSQQSGLREPDANQAARTSGSESQEDCSLSAVTWEHGCPHRARSRDHTPGGW